MLGFSASLYVVLQPVTEVTLASLQKSAKEANVNRLPIGSRMEFYARALVGTPYVGWTLDRDPANERCTVLLDGLDCVTFMETVLNLARTKVDGAEPLRDSVTFTRYRNGKLNGYLSRLHYTTDWISDNALKRVLRNVTKSLPGSAPFVRTINFMSAHADLYPALRANPQLVDPLKLIESRISANEMYFVPKQSLRDAQKK